MATYTWETIDDPNSWGGRGRAVSLDDLLAYIVDDYTLIGNYSVKVTNDETHESVILDVNEAPFENKREWVQSKLQSIITENFSRVYGIFERFNDKPLIKFEADNNEEIKNFFESFVNQQPNKSLACKCLTEDTKRDLDNNSQQLNEALDPATIKKVLEVASIINDLTPEIVDVLDDVDEKTGASDKSKVIAAFKKKLNQIKNLSLELSKLKDLKGLFDSAKSLVTEDIKKFRCTYLDDELGIVEANNEQEAYVKARSMWPDQALNDPQNIIEIEEVVEE